MNILFLCVANSARSQIAEGLAKAMLGSNHNIHSAGSIPSGKVHPNAKDTMMDINIDISKQYSKSINELDNFFMDNLDYVITLCAEEVCPILNNKAKKIHWPNPDPDNKLHSDLQLRTSFQNTRNNISSLIKDFKISILNGE